ncbi:MAG TPA: leucine-rich repeat protein [Clostridia bacterium]|jgi:hypothetical protein|nr:MAG: hypothetical protein BWX97_00414 [Firmicutes bacterium ADurb.Bin146]HOD93736.1 leucine-rich repeat protein [Clostridia bacterium]HQM39922.1 leucine-rich repeat protein [Clostridia bacterium]
MKKVLVVFVLITVLLLSACNNGSEPTGDLKEGSFTYTIKDNEITITEYDGVEESVIIPETIRNIPVVHIKDMAFSACVHVKEVFIPESVKSIGVCAFNDTEWYKNLKDEFVIVGDGILIKCNQTETDIVIPEGVKSLSSTFYEAGVGGFFNAVIYLPSTLKKVDRYAFYKAYGNIVICNMEQIEQIGESAFEDSTIDHIIISDKLKSIEDRAFATTNQKERPLMRMEMIGNDGYYVGTQKMVQLPFSTTLGKDIFYGLEGNMETVKFEEGTTSITKEMLINMQQFTKFFISAEVTHIEKDALPKGAIIYTKTVSTAENYANDNAIELVTLPENFRDKELERLLIPAFIASNLEFTYENMQKITSIRIDDQIEGNVFEYDYVYVKVNATVDIMGIDHILKQGNVMSLEDLKFFTKLDSLFLNSTIIDSSIDYTVLKSMPALTEVVVNHKPLKQ